MGPIPKIKKAIVAVAGAGTRFLTVTKTMPKEMLPIVDKPIIQLVVEKLVEAGMQDIILVSKWDKKALELRLENSRLFLYAHLIPRVEGIHVFFTLKESHLIT